MARTGEAEIVARGNVALRWQPGPAVRLTEAQRRKVDAIWEAGRARLGDALYDAPILACRRLEILNDVAVLHGVYQPYRFYYAQRQASRLNCGVDVIGVSGIVTLDDGNQRAVAVGRRSDKMAQYTGRWECIPSGGIDDACARADGTVDYVAMLLHEFEEEVCLPTSEVDEVTPLAVIYDPVARNYDVCCELHTRITANAFRQALERSAEYTELMLIRESDWDDRLRELGDGLIPISRALLQVYRGGHAVR
jgi:hypothetical protein